MGNHGRKSGYYREAARPRRQTPDASFLGQSITEMPAKPNYRDALKECGRNPADTT